MGILTKEITDADLTGIKVTDRADKFSGAPATSKAWFDAVPLAIRTHYNDLLDYLDVQACALTVTVAANLTSKGSFSGFVPEGGIVEVLFELGNTAASPTIEIDGDPYSITGLPDYIGANECFVKLKRVSSNELAFYSQGDYLVEKRDSVVTEGTWQVYSYSSGRKVATFRAVLTFSGTSTFGSTGLYQQTVEIDPPSNFIPTGGDQVNIKTTGGIVFTSSNTAINSHVWYNATGPKVGCQIARTASANANYSTTFVLNYTA